MVFSTRTGEVAPQYDRGLQLLEQGWDFQQRVEILGVTGIGTGSVTVRSKNSEATVFLQLHIQTDQAGEGGATYSASTFRSSVRVDCRAARQQDHPVTRDLGETVYVWIIPVFLQGDQTTYTIYDGVDGEDRMVFIEIGPNEGLFGESFTAFADGDATPSVANGTKFQTANTSPTTITDFDDGFEGQTITVWIDDANTTVDFTASGLLGNGGADWSPASGDHMTCVYNGTDWLCDVSEN